MVKQNRGKIINIASGYGLRGGKHNFMYACAKGGTIQLTCSMALTYAQFNIQTNCIVPGVFPHNEATMQFFKGGKFIPIGRVSARTANWSARGVPRLGCVRPYQRRTDCD